MQQTATTGGLPATETQKRTRTAWGTRKVTGRWKGQPWTRYYVLAGRGTREFCRAEATELRKSWRFVRVFPASRKPDDYMLYVFEWRQ